LTCPSTAYMGQGTLALSKYFFSKTTLNHFRQPKQSAFYQLVEGFYPQSAAAYEQRYQECYGFWRPAIATAVQKFLECGDLHQGFARVRCPKCAHEFFVAFSVPGRF